MPVGSPGSAIEDNGGIARRGIDSNGADRRRRDGGSRQSLFYGLAGDHQSFGRIRFNGCQREIKCGILAGCNRGGEIDGLVILPLNAKSEFAGFEGVSHDRRQANGIAIHKYRCICRLGEY